jgi:hypothetical protein
MHLFLSFNRASRVVNIRLGINRLLPKLSWHGVWPITAGWEVFPWRLALQLGFMLTCRTFPPPVLPLCVLVPNEDLLILGVFDAAFSTVLVMKRRMVGLL